MTRSDLETAIDGAPPDFRAAIDIVARPGLEIGVAAATLAATIKL
jgi:hypothetical protein